MFSSVSNLPNRDGVRVGSEMVDIEGAYWNYFGSHTIQNVLSSESSTSSDSGIVSDCNSDGDTVSVAEEVDYSKKLQDAIR